MPPCDTVFQPLEEPEKHSSLFHCWMEDHQGQDYLNPKEHKTKEVTTNVSV